jgi:hypothetical protein
VSGWHGVYLDWERSKAGLQGLKSIKHLAARLFAFLLIAFPNRDFLIPRLRLDILTLNWNFIWDLFLSFRPYPVGLSPSLSWRGPPESALPGTSLSNSRMGWPSRPSTRTYLRLAKLMRNTAPTMTKLHSSYFVWIMDYWIRRNPGHCQDTLHTNRRRD